MPAGEHLVRGRNTARLISACHKKPRLIAGLRLSLGPAWVYLISAEAIASDIGLGYRIFLVRRYLSMDIIIPYVAWISILAIVMDVALMQLSRRAFVWAHQSSR